MYTLENIDAHILPFLDLATLLQGYALFDDL